MGIILGYDLTTLRENVDSGAAEARLAELGQLRSLSALNEKVELLRLLGRLDEAMVIANEAVRQSRFAGDREELVIARTRRAQVLQFQGKIDPALVDLTDCINEALAHSWDGAAAFALQSRGSIRFDQQDYSAARHDYREALTLRVRTKAPAESIDACMVAIAVTDSYLEDDE